MTQIPIHSREQVEQIVANTIRQARGEQHAEITQAADAVAAQVAAQVEQKKRDDLFDSIVELRQLDKAFTDNPEIAARCGGCRSLEEAASGQFGEVALQVAEEFVALIDGIDPDSDIDQALETITEDVATKLEGAYPSDSLDLSAAELNRPGDLLKAMDFDKADMLGSDHLFSSERTARAMDTFHNTYRSNATESELEVYDHGHDPDAGKTFVLRGDAAHRDDAIWDAVRRDTPDGRDLTVA